MYFALLFFFVQCSHFMLFASCPFRVLDIPSVIDSCRRPAILSIHGELIICMWFHKHSIINIIARSYGFFFFWKALTLFYAIATLKF